MSKIGIIGGSGITSFAGLEVSEQKFQKTPYGQHSGVLTFGKFANQEVVFLPRHGNPHVIPPHKINYQANIWALKEIGVEQVLAVNSVGGITPKITPEKIVVPHQLIDYTWGRSYTFFENGLNEVTHVDFSWPYTESLRQQIIATGNDLGLGMHMIPQATYGATQGPRLETAAEVLRMEKDGCDLVGMTGMPEAVLAREANLEYASICMVVNWAAGKDKKEISMDVINNNLLKCSSIVRRLLAQLLNSL